LNYDSKALIQPGGYSSVVIINMYHNLATANEAITLNSTSPSGVSVSFTPASPVQLPASKPLNVTVNVRASTSLKVGNYTINVSGVSGPYSQTANFTLRVVQYRVIMVGSAFMPGKLNVTQGSTVYWQNLDGPVAGCAGKVEGTGAHSVVFTTIPGANSTSISQFGFYQYTFNTPGNYFYYSSLNSDHIMNGTIVVTLAGGGPGGMAVIMPAFSHFKQISNTAATSAPTMTTVNRPNGTAERTGPIAAGNPALDGPVLLNANSPTVSILALEAGHMVSLSFIALGLALATIALGKKGLTTTVAGFITRLLP
jgi:plastocyanin